MKKILTLTAILLLVKTSYCQENKNFQKFIGIGPNIDMFSLGAAEHLEIVLGAGIRADAMGKSGAFSLNIDGNFNSHGDGAIVSSYYVLDISPEAKLFLIQGEDGKIYMGLQPSWYLNKKDIHSPNKETLTRTTSWSSLGANICLGVSSYYYNNLNVSPYVSFGVVTNNDNEKAGYVFKIGLRFGKEWL